MAAPSGTVTFLFADIEGSTTLWQQHPEGMKQALAQHDEIIRNSIEKHTGYVFKTVGAAFTVALDAIESAVRAQRTLADAAWGETGPIEVRMAIHTGAADERDCD